MVSDGEVLFAIPVSGGSEVFLFEDDDANRLSIVEFYGDSKQCVLALSCDDVIEPSGRLEIGFPMTPKIAQTIAMALKKWADSKEQK